jgi:hypothetical protein
MLNDGLYYAIDNPNSIVWWCNPTYRIVKRDYRRFLTGIRKTPIFKYKSDSELRIELTNGSTIEFFGLDKHDNLRGEGVDRLYVDEAATVKEAAIMETLRPMLLDTKGSAVFFGTPKGKNWFHKYYLKGLETGSNVKSFCFPTKDNPYIDKVELNNDLRDLPRRVIEQEYEAKFIDAGNGVFAGYNECITGEYPFPKDILKTSKYRIGVDIAKHIDFTVLTTIDIKTKQVVDWQRVNQEDYGLIKQRITAKAKEFNNAEIVLDSTGVGDPVYDDLLRAGLNIIPFKFTNSSKIQLIENLVIAIQNKTISFPSIPELVNELDIFEYSKTPGGAVKYSAPSGYHDDCVISLALACWDIENIITDYSIESVEIKGELEGLMF